MKTGLTQFLPLQVEMVILDHWRPINQDQVLTTWSEVRQNGLVLNLRLCDVTALQASKSDINIQ